METLIPFLKHSNVVDLMVLSLVILTALILIPAGIWLAIASRSRKPIYFFLIMALLPLGLALLGTFLRIKKIERVISMFPEAGAEIIAASRQEAWITAYIGAVGTAVPSLIGVTGLILKKERKA